VVPSKVAVMWCHWPGVRGWPMLTQRGPVIASLNWNPRLQLAGEPYLSCQLQADDPEAADTLLATPRFLPVEGEHIS